MTIVTPEGIQLIASAVAFASDAHIHQVRKELNEPYIVHPIRCGNMAAALGMDPEFIAAMYLHDVVEDTSIPMATIQAIFPERTASLVQAMTKWWGDSAGDSEQIREWKKQYHDRLLREPDGALMKVIDRTDNLRDFLRMAQMSPKSHKWAARYAKKTREEFPELLAAVTHKKAVDQFNAALVTLESVL